MVFRAIEVQADGTTVLVTLHVAGLFDDVLGQQFCRDFGDCRRGEFNGLGDLGAGADAVVIQILQDA